MERNMKSLIYPAIAVLILTVIDAVFAFAGNESIPPTVRYTSSAVWLFVEGWAFYSMFRISEEKTVFRSGAVLGLVGVLFGVLNFVARRLEWAWTPSYVFIYMPLVVFVAIAVVMIVSSCKPKKGLLFVGWALTILRLLIPVLSSMVDIRVIQVITLLEDLLFAGFLFLVAKAEIKEKESQPMLFSNILLMPVCFLAAIAYCFGVNNLLAKEVFMSDGIYDAKIYTTFVYLSIIIALISIVVAGSNRKLLKQSAVTMDLPKNGAGSWARRWCFGVGIFAIAMATLYLFIGEGAVDAYHYELFESSKLLAFIDPDLVPLHFAVSFVGLGLMLLAIANNVLIRKDVLQMNFHYSDASHLPQLATEPTTKQAWAYVLTFLAVLSLLYLVPVLIECIKDLVDSDFYKDIVTITLYLVFSTVLFSLSLFTLGNVIHQRSLIKKIV